MEPHETALNSYFHQHQQPPTTAGSTNAASPASNGTLLPNHVPSAPADGTNTTVLYPQSLAGKAPTPPLDMVKKKRGRPRKYATPEAAAAAKRAASTSLSPPPLSRKRESQVVGSPPSTSSTSKKSQLATEADTAQCFMPHVINVNPEEDVAKKIQEFAQQSRKELCILSASGCIRNAILLQPAAAGGSLSYEGFFHILSLSGSFVRTDHGVRSGGLSACLACHNGDIIGGGIIGPLIAAGPVEVIVATFQIEQNKDISSGNQGDAAASTVASPPGASVSTGGYRPVFEPPGRYGVPATDEHQNVVGNPFLMHHHGLHMGSSQSTDWRVSPDSRSGFNYDFTGRTGHEANESSENGEFEHLPD